MKLLRGVFAVGDNSNATKTVALVFNEKSAWLNFGYEYYPLSQDEVRELGKVFRQAVESWDRKGAVSDGKG